MEIRKSKYLFVDTRGERQQRQSRTTPEVNAMDNQLRDSTDSFEALLARQRQSRTQNLTDSLNQAQMQAQKSALLDEYASTLARLSHDFSHQLGSDSLHLSEIIDHAEDPQRLNALLARLDGPARHSTEQFIQAHQVQIHSLNLKGQEIQAFPRQMETWLTQQQPTTALSDNPLARHTAGNPDAERYQQLSDQYQQFLQELKGQYNDATNALLQAAQHSPVGQRLTLSGILEALAQPSEARQPELQQWLTEQASLVQTFSQSQQRQQTPPDLASWARLQGVHHPWLHS